MEIDLSHLPAATRSAMDEIFRKDFDLKVLQAIRRQTATAAAQRDRVRWHDQMLPRYVIDPMVDKLWRHYYGHNYTESADLMRFLAARNPEILLQARSPKTRVGYVGPVGPLGRVRPNRSKTGCRFGRGTLEWAK